ncbi:MAG: C10 family peptidase [Microbacter sp.]
MQFILYFHTFRKNVSKSVSLIQMHRFPLFFVLFSMAIGSVVAKPVTPTKAKAMAQKFYQQRLTQSGLAIAHPSMQKGLSPSAFKLEYAQVRSGRSATVSAPTTVSADSMAYFYVFNVGNNNGFVLVAGDDGVKPILGYALQGTFNANQIPSNVQSWLNMYKNQIKAVQSAPTVVSDTVPRLTASNTVVLSDSVAPLLGQLMWDQDIPYNILCPYNSTAKQHTETGCVATAMAQIMKYYQWPVTGKGSNSYTDGSYGTLSVNFANVTYDWNNMLNSYGATTTGKQDTAVATLMYDCGVAVNMQYDLAANGGSSASTSDAGNALINYFQYDSGIQSYDRSLYNETQWELLLQNELKNQRPVLYAGTADSLGHAFVIDGFDSNDLYHINWGWGGLFNGYFELTALNPDWAGNILTLGGYSTDQQMIAGIQKPVGTSHVSYQLGTYDQGMTTSTNYLNSISTQTFNVSYGLMNFGINAYSGKIGVGLFQNGTFVKSLASRSISGLGSYYYYSSLGFNNLSISGTTSGTYQLYAIYQPADSTTWSIIKQSGSYNNTLTVNINGTTATIQKSTPMPLLTLTQPVQMMQNAYQNKTTVVNVTIQNSGVDFNSYLSLYLYSKTDSATNHQVLQQGVLCIPAGSTQTVTFAGVVNCPPGTYYAVAMADSTNNGSTTTYQMLKPTTENPISFNVFKTPGSPNLVVTTPIAFTNGSSQLYNNQPISITATIQNKGGYFDSTLVAFVFPVKGGSSLTTLNPQTVFLDSLQTKTIVLTGTIDLNPGSYFFGLFYYAGGWIECTPLNQAELPFTLNALNTAITNVATQSLTIFPNPATTTLYIEGMENQPTQVFIFDISGKMVLNQQLSSSFIDIGALAKGLYVLQIRNNTNVKNIQFIKN